jgi:hypothetical protein
VGRVANRIINEVRGINQVTCDITSKLPDEQRAGDEVLSRPKKGKGASLTMRYRLPRN